VNRSAGIRRANHWPPRFYCSERCWHSPGVLIAITDSETHRAFVPHPNKVRAGLGSWSTKVSGSSPIVAFKTDHGPHGPSLFVQSNRGCSFPFVEITPGAKPPDRLQSGRKARTVMATGNVCAKGTSDLPIDLLHAFAAIERATRRCKRLAGSTSNWFPQRSVFPDAAKSYRRGSCPGLENGLASSSSPAKTTKFRWGI